MKTTDKQIAANRRNAAKSTGPKTAGGKATASRNAIKHGLLAREIVIDAGEGAESREEFETVLLTLTDQFDPNGPLKHMLVEKIAVAYWRLRRAHRYEVGLIRHSLDNATESYYADERQSPTFRQPVHVVLPPDTRPVNRPDDRIDAEIRQVQQRYRQCESDRKKLARMQRNGADLKAVYDRENDWNALYNALPEEIEELDDESPAGIRQAAREAGWTNEDIWEFFRDRCAEQLPRLENEVRKLEKEKERNALALQVRKKLGCLPAGHDLDKLLKYEGAIERQFYKAIDQLERLQRLRAGDSVPAPLNIDLAVKTDEPH